MTTCVGGNCGVGFAPCRKSMRDWTIDLCEGVEDIPHESLAVGMPWEWESFPEYLDAVARRPLALDIGFFISHGPLRAYCMGEECNATDKPGGRTKAYVSDSDIEKMKRTVKEAIEAGALGFSTNRFQGALFFFPDVSADELLLVFTAIQMYFTIFCVLPFPRLYNFDLSSFSSVMTLSKYTIPKSSIVL